MAIENMKLKLKNMKASSNFKRDLSKSTDKLLNIQYKSVISVSKGKKTLKYDSSPGNTKDFAFDSFGGLIKIKKKTDIRLEK